MARLTAIQREFLQTVADGDDVFPFLQRQDFGYGWAVELGLVRKHPAWFEFEITPAGRSALAEEE